MWTSAIHAGSMPLHEVLSHSYTLGVMILRFSAAHDAVYADAVCLVSRFKVRFK